MKSSIAKFQIGKNGLTQGVIESLSLALRNHKRVVVSALKSSGRDKTTIRRIASEIQEKLPVKCNYRIVGFKITLMKTSPKAKKQSL